MPTDPSKGSTLSLYYTRSDMDRWKAFAISRNLRVSTAVKRLIDLGLEYEKVKARPTPQQQPLPSPQLDLALRYLEGLIELSAENVAHARSKAVTVGSTPARVAQDALEVAVATVQKARVAAKGGK